MSVIEIHKKAVFDVHEARALLPVVKKITQKYSKNVDMLINQLENLNSEDLTRIEEVEEIVNTEIQEWHKKMKSLGLYPKGLWVVDFDNGKGFFCWKNPEEDILFWHSYDKGFKARRPIGDFKNLDFTEDLGDSSNKLLLEF